MKVELSLEEIKILVTALDNCDFEYWGPSREEVKAFESVEKKLDIAKRAFSNG